MTNGAGPAGYQAERSLLMLDRLGEDLVRRPAHDICTLLDGLGPGIKQADPEGAAGRQEA
jgi:hypothetical protein